MWQVISLMDKLLSEVCTYICDLSCMEQILHGAWWHHQTRMCSRGAPLWVVLSLLLWRVSYCGYADRWGYCLAQFATSPLVRGARTQHHCLCSSGSLRLVLACRWIGPGPSELAACLVGGGWGQGRCQTTSGQDRVPPVVGYAALTRRGAGDG